MTTLDSHLTFWIGKQRDWSRRLVSRIKFNSILLWLAVPLCLFLFLFRSASEPIRLNWGDPMSDLNAMTAGRYFKDYGFLATRFTPIQDIGALSDKSMRYTHYPPLPDLINGALQTLGVTKIVHFRYIALLFSALGIVALFGALNLIYGLEAAVWAIVLLTSNYLWLQYADSLHHFPLYFCFSSLALWCCTSWLTHKKNRFLAGLFASVALAYLSSYDVWFALPILALASIPLMGRSFKEANSLRLLITAGAGACFGVGVKFGLVCWSYGSVSAFLADLTFQSDERGLVYLTQAGFFRSLLLALGGGTLRFFSPLFPAIAIVYLWLGLKKLRLRDRRQSAPPNWIKTSPLWFLAAGVPFLCVFPELTLGQIHPMAQLLLFYAVGIAVLLTALRSRSVREQAAAGAILLAALAWQAIEITACRRFLVSETSWREMGTLVESTDSRFVLTDMPTVDSPLRYYLNRYPIFLQFGGPPSGPATLSARVKALLETEGSRSILMLKYRHFTEIAFDQAVRRVPLVLRKRFGSSAFRDSVRRSFEEINTGMQNFVDGSGTLRAVLPEYDVYEISLTSLRRYVDQQVRLGLPTTALRFSGLFNLDLDFDHPIAGLWQSGDGVKTLWAGDRQIKSPVFTLQGIRWVPTGRYETETATLRFKVTPGADHYLGLELTAAVPGQNLELFLDGHGVGAFTLADPGIPNRVHTLLPKDLFPKDGLVKLELRFSKRDEDRLAAKLIALNVTSATSDKAGPFK